MTEPKFPQLDGYHVCPVPPPSSAPVESRGVVKRRLREAMAKGRSSITIHAEHADALVGELVAAGWAAGIEYVEGHPNMRKVDWSEP